MPTLEPDAGRAYSFGPFRLNVAQKQVTEAGVPLRLGSRAFELLAMLVEYPGVVLSRQQIEARVWPRVVVEETSLRVHIAAVRKALRDGVDGARYITNIPGRGYCFVAPVQAFREAMEPAAAIALAANRAHNNLPTRLASIVGRKEATAALGEHLRDRRLVSIVGPGGIGKTTVALAAAAEHIASYEHGAVFVDFAPLGSPALVPATVALAIGSQPTGGSLVPQICEFLRDRRMLLVLDNCEHVIGAAAHLVESVMAAAPEVHILTTTREPLFSEGEWVYWLLALDAPPPGDELSRDEALAYPAIRLFVERAEANSDGFALTEETLPAVRQLCTRLDGIPLAIELAAARVGSLGVVALAQRLDDLFQLLNRGRRTAMPRHRTLEALLDWSYDLLTEREQAVLRHLSVFRSWFDLEAAASVAASDGIDAATVAESVSSLALKSLVHADLSRPGSQYRLLYMTRAYAARKLAASGEMRQVRLRHAVHHRRVASAAASRWGPTAAERVAVFGPLMDDLRAALDWAFSADGDVEIGLGLTADGWVATVALGFTNEYRARVEHALERLQELPAPDPKLELALCVCWCFLSGQTPGMGGAKQAEMFDRVLSLAPGRSDAERHAEALYAIATGAFGQGDYATVSRLMTDLRAVVDGDSQPLSVLVGDRLMVLAHHYLGHHAAARVLAQRVLHYPAQPRHTWFIGQVPRSVSMLIVEARTLWLTGAPDRAAEVARQSVENALGEHSYALAQALGLAAIPVAIWRGDEDQARDLTQALRDHAARHSIPYWQSWAESFGVVLASSARDEDRGQEPVGWTSNPNELDMLVTLCPRFLLPATLARVDAGRVGWCAPEVLRVQALCLLRSEGATAAEQGLALMQRGLALARAQGALAWELRIATSLAELGLPCAREAHALLSQLLARFTEGLQTRDVSAARRVLEALETGAGGQGKLHA